MEAVERGTGEASGASVVDIGSRCIAVVVADGVGTSTG